MTYIMNEAMKRVRRIYVLRRLAAPFVVCLCSVAVIASTVSVASVLRNMPDLFDIQAVARFLLAAFAHTDIVIKSALVAGIAFLIMTLKRAFETMRYSSSHVEA
jgi:hypothetical protein